MGFLSQFPDPHIGHPVLVVHDKFIDFPLQFVQRLDLFGSKHGILLPAAGSWTGQRPVSIWVYRTTDPFFRQEGHRIAFWPRVWYN